MGPLYYRLLPLVAHQARATLILSADCYLLVHSSALLRSTRMFIFCYIFHAFITFYSRQRIAFVTAIGDIGNTRVTASP